MWAKMRDKECKFYCYYDKESAKEGRRTRQADVCAKNAVEGGIACIINGQLIISKNVHNIKNLKIDKCSKFCSRCIYKPDASVSSVSHEAFCLEKETLTKKRGRKSGKAKTNQ